MCCTAAAPEPLSVTEAGELVALLTKATLPEAVPLLVGANFTLAFWLAPAARVNGKVTPLTLNPEPVMLAEETVTVELPVLLTVIAFVEELPTVTEPKLIEVGDAETSMVLGALMVTLASALESVLAALVA